MIVTYFRSSSFNTYDNCQQQYFLNYVLGLEHQAGKSATKGNVVHKALEWLALYKQCLQNNTETFNDDALGLMSIHNCDPEYLIKLSFDWHVKNFNHDNWEYEKDLRDCTRWMFAALRFKNGLFDPRKRKIVSAEQTFDIEINEPWSKYHYKMPDGNMLSGNLTIKGTIDLITEVRPGVLEIIDWKTGGYRTNFATGKVKEYNDFFHDPQLRLYHYAASKIFPQYKHILITIYFIRAGGPFSIPLGEEDFQETEIMLKKQFEKIQRTVRPTLNPKPKWSKNPNPYTNWKCMKRNGEPLCTFAKPSKFDPSKTECQFFRDKIIQVGMDNVVKQHADLNKINNYQDGGGRKAKKEGENKDE